MEPVVDLASLGTSAIAQCDDTTIPQAMAYEVTKLCIIFNKNKIFILTFILITF
jgi:hypothetical protein